MNLCQYLPRDNLSIIIHGAKIGYCGPGLGIIGGNLPSATNDMDAVTTGLGNRIAAGRLTELSYVGNHFISSPLGLAPKSNGKWYGGWARPELSKAADQGKVDAVFLAFVEGDLCKHQLIKRMARTSGASDSSGSHERMVPTRHRGYKARNVAKRERMYGRLY